MRIAHKIIGLREAAASASVLCILVLITANHGGGKTAVIWPPDVALMYLRFAGCRGEWPVENMSASIIANRQAAIIATSGNSCGHQNGLRRRRELAEVGAAAGIGVRMKCQRRGGVLSPRKLRRGAAAPIARRSNAKSA